MLAACGITEVLVNTLASVFSASSPEPNSDLPHSSPIHSLASIPSGTEASFTGRLKNEPEDFEVVEVAPSGELLKPPSSLPLCAASSTFSCDVEPKNDDDVNHENEKCVAASSVDGSSFSSSPSLFTDASGWFHFSQAAIAGKKSQRAEGDLLEMEDDIGEEAEEGEEEEEEKEVGMGEKDVLLSSTHHEGEGKEKEKVPQSPSFPPPSSSSSSVISTNTQKKPKMEKDGEKESSEARHVSMYSSACPPTHACASPWVRSATGRRTTTAVPRKIAWVRTTTHPAYQKGLQMAIRAVEKCFGTTTTLLARMREGQGQWPLCEEEEEASSTGRPLPSSSFSSSSVLSSPLPWHAPSDPLLPFLLSPPRRPIPRLFVSSCGDISSSFSSSTASMTPVWGPPPPHPHHAAADGLWCSFDTALAVPLMGDALSATARDDDDDDNEKKPKSEEKAAHEAETTKKGTIVDAASSREGVSPVGESQQTPDAAVTTTPDRLVWTRACRQRLHWELGQRFPFLHTFIDPKRHAMAEEGREKENVKREEAKKTMMRESHNTTRTEKEDEEDEEEEEVKKSMKRRRASCSSLQETLPDAGGCVGVPLHHRDEEDSDDSLSWLVCAIDPAFLLFVLLLDQDVAVHIKQRSVNEVFAGGATSTSSPSPSAWHSPSRQRLPFWVGKWRSEEEVCALLHYQERDSEEDEKKKKEEEEKVTGVGEGTRTETIVSDHPHPHPVEHSKRLSGASFSSSSSSPMVGLQTVNRAVLLSSLRRTFHDVLRRRFRFLSCHVSYGKVTLFTARPPPAVPSSSPSRTAACHGPTAEEEAKKRHPPPPPVAQAITREWEEERERPKKDGSPFLSHGLPSSSPLPPSAGKRPEKCFIHAVVGKRNVDSMAMKAILADYVGCPAGSICVAGMKDRRAITYQRISFPVMADVLSSWQEDPHLHPHTKENAPHWWTARLPIRLTKTGNGVEAWDASGEKGEGIRRSFPSPCRHRTTSSSAGCTGTAEEGADGSWVTVLALSSSSSSSSHAEGFSAPIQLGQLKGNWFSICVRDVQRVDPDGMREKGSSSSSPFPALPEREGMVGKVEETPPTEASEEEVLRPLQARLALASRIGVINYFGQQRFSLHVTALSDHTGLYLFRHDYVGAVRSLFRAAPQVYAQFPWRMDGRFAPSNSRDMQIMANALKHVYRSYFRHSPLRGKDETMATMEHSVAWQQLCRIAMEKKIPYALRRMWINAAQSVVFNRCASLLAASVMADLRTYLCGGDRDGNDPACPFFSSFWRAASDTIQGSRPSPSSTSRWNAPLTTQEGGDPKVAELLYWLGRLRIPLSWRWGDEPENHHQCTGTSSSSSSATPTAAAALKCTHQMLFSLSPEEEEEGEEEDEKTDLLRAVPPSAAAAAERAKRLSSAAHCRRYVHHRLLHALENALHDVGYPGNGNEVEEEGRSPRSTSSTSFCISPSSSSSSSYPRLFDYYQQKEVAGVLLSSASRSFLTRPEGCSMRTLPPTAREHETPTPSCLSLSPSSSSCASMAPTMGSDVGFTFYLPSSSYATVLLREVFLRDEIW